MTSKTVPNRHGSAVVTLQSDTDMLVVRKFDAPAALVFDAFTTPAFVERWWGFASSEWLVCEGDVRVGGRWRYVFRERGMEVGFRGEYREVARPDRLVYTELYEGAPGATDDDAAVNTVTFQEEDGVTTMRVLTRFKLPEHRDAAIASGMEGGMQVSYDRMEDLLRDLPRR